MQDVIQRFKELSLIPRCSHRAGAMRDYLETEGKRLGCEVRCDAAGNVLWRRERAVATLQAHYDMVCIGDVDVPHLYEEAGWLKARGSTLGADNGIGMAMMVELAREGAPVDCLFTADEEVGLLGARALELPLREVPMLNLDSEEEGVVTIGCAGGVDIAAEMASSSHPMEGYGYRFEVSGLPGGHSGVDIDKGIPNAIKELARLLDASMHVAELSGGERRNAIPKAARALIVTETPLGELPEGAVPLGRGTWEVLEQSAPLVGMLKDFGHGVRRLDEALGIVHTSINLAQIEAGSGGISVHLSARSMEGASLRELEAQTLKDLSGYGFAVRSEGFYEPWPPERTPFARKVFEVSREILGTSDLGAIHAGLECGVIRERYPAIDMASIGPNIVAPHSTAERLEIASVGRIMEVVRGVIAALD